MWIHSGNGFASAKSQGCLCREVVKISVSAEPRSTNGHEGGNFDKRPVLALELFIPEVRYRIRAPLTPPAKYPSAEAKIVRKRNYLRHSFCSYAVTLKGLAWTSDQSDQSIAI